MHDKYVNKIVEEGPAVYSFWESGEQREAWTKTSLESSVVYS